MELLGPTLRDLENAGRVFGNLDDHYIGKVYPQFKDDLKNLGIPDIHIYESYNLKNVLDDLSHIQTLSHGSPKKDQFKKKVQFLVDLSQRTIKKLKQPNKELKELNREKPQPVKTSAKNSIEDQAKKLTKAKTVELPEVHSKAADVQVEETSKKENNADSSYLSPKKSKENKKVLPPKKRVSAIEAKPLAKISEEVEASDLEGSPLLKVKALEEPEAAWTLTPVQQEMVQNTLKKYDMSEDVWRNYILSRVQGDTQLRRLGIEVPREKVDCHIETLKFVEELERHMSRRARTKTHRPYSVGLPPLEADQASHRPELKGFELFPVPCEDSSTNIRSVKARTLPSVEVDITALEQSDLLKKVPLTATAVLQKSREDFVSGMSSEPSYNLADTPVHLPISHKKFLPIKTWALASLSPPCALILQESQIIEGFDTGTGPIDLYDSLHESLNIDHASMHQYNKSQGHYKLPSISSSNSHMKNFSNLQDLDSLISHKMVSGRRYKRASGYNPKLTRTLQTESKIDSSLEDSLEEDSLDNGKKVSHEHKKGFRISSVGTIRSRYLSSCGDMNFSGKHSFKEGEAIINNNRGKILVEGEDLGQSSASQDYQTGIQSKDPSLVSESLNERSSIKTLSAKTLDTVCSMEGSVQLTLSRKISQNTKARILAQTIYSGDVKRLCLLGSGSEAKVFLCKIKDYDYQVALKQYDLVKNHRRNDEAYDGLNKEFEMLRNLDHENIIKYLCLYKPSRSTYNNCLEFGIIMEYMPGGSLDSCIDDHFDSLSFDMKKKIMKQILSGLDYLHQHNIIHRDLKPGNILLSEDKTMVKISDFGISKKISGETATRRTLVGTPWYMAPEVINQEGYSSKADIWSAGCCLFHLVTGEKPYNTANAIQALMLMVNHKSPLEVCRPEILARINEHPGVLEFLEYCFNRNKDERPNAGELLQHPLFNEI